MSIQVNIRKILFITLWSVIGAGALVLLIAAINNRNNKNSKGYDIEITGAGGRLFIDKKEVLNILANNGGEQLTGKAITSFNLHQMKDAVEKDPWVKKAQLFFDNNEILRINITERQPVARIFTAGGNSFYIDSSGAQMPLSDRMVVKVPVFTNYPYEKVKTHGSDSVFLEHIKKLGWFIGNDPFWMAQVAQVDITPAKTFEMAAEVGNHLIEFGDGSDCEKKFRRLFIFYKEVLSKTGFDKYSRINIAYNGQVIGTKKGSGITRSDSLQAIKNIQQLIRSARQLQADTVSRENIKPLEHSTEADQVLNYDLFPDNGDSVRGVSNPKPKIKPVSERKPKN